MLYNPTFFTLMPEWCEKLRNLGFDEYCDVCYANVVDVSPEIREQYPGLSDDGYYELTKRGGGNLRWNQVYKKQWILSDSKYYGTMNSEFEAPYDAVSAPALDRIQRWFRFERGIDVIVHPLNSVMKNSPKVNVAPYPFDKKPVDARLYTFSVRFTEWNGSTELFSFDFSGKKAFQTSLTGKLKRIISKFGNSYNAFHSIDHALSTGLKVAITLAENNISLL